MRRSTVALSCLVLVVALTGCGGGEDTAVPNEPAAAPAPAASAPAEPASAEPAADPTATSSATASSATASEAALRIEIRDFKFVPEVLEARAGQKITVTNADAATHTLTADDGSIDSKDLGAGDSFTFTAPAADLPYHCEPHQYMTGRIDIS